MNAEKLFGKNVKVLWHDRKRYFGMPISFTRYYIVEKEGSWMKLFVRTGLLATQSEEVNIFRVSDFSLNRTLFDKLFKVGSIVLYASDDNEPEIWIQKVKNPFEVRALLSELVEKERAKKGFRLSEIR